MRRAARRSARRSARSGPCAARRRSTSAAPMPRPRSRSAARPARSRRARPRRSASARPPSTSLMASSATNGIAVAARPLAGAPRRARGRRDGRWPRGRAGPRRPSKTIAARAARSRTPAGEDPVARSARGWRPAPAGPGAVTWRASSSASMTRPAELAEHGGHRRLAAADGPGEADDERVRCPARLPGRLARPSAHRGARSCERQPGVLREAERRVDARPAPLPRRRSSTKLAWHRGVAEAALERTDLRVPETLEVGLDALAARAG